jgi:TonB family protein
VTTKPILGIWVLCACLGCGGANEPPKAAAPAKVAVKPRPKVKRSLSAAQVKSTMNEQVASMAACYELSPSKANDAAGELTVDFTVEANGTVSGESLEGDSLEDKVLGECVLGVVRKTAFPKSETSMDVSWPLHFGAR